MKQYLAVTSDVYELPIAAADTPSGLAKILNTTVNNVMSSISHGNSGKIKGYKFISVEIGDPYATDINDFKVN